MRATIWPFKSSERLPVVAPGCSCRPAVKAGRTASQVYYVFSRIRLTSGEIGAGARCR